MSAELNLKVKALEPLTDAQAFVFAPANLNVKVGMPNSNLQTCDIYFELKDDGAFDTTVYTGMERIFRGNMNIPLATVAQLINGDGSYNVPVINGLLAIANLQLRID